MGQVSIVAYATAGSFLPIAYWDIYFTVLVALAAARVLVARAVKVDAPDRSRAWRTRMAGAVAAPAGGPVGVRGAVGRTVLR